MSTANVGVEVAPNLDNLAEDDQRSQLQEAVAETLSELSEGVDAPNGVRPGSPFRPSDVDFASDSWVQRLGDVQGWLRLGEDLHSSSYQDFIESLVGGLGFEPSAEGIEVLAGAPRLTDAALERLKDRSELAVRLQHAFSSDLEADGGSRSSASADWVKAWEAAEDLAADVEPEPVTAKADVWHIFQLTKTKLNLTPSYQRGDVWRTGDRQQLIESILRGIPLPSIILLRTGGTKPHDVVDGKQRLTSILRFVGLHPEAVEKVNEVDRLHPEAGLKRLFHEDYPTFRTVWRNTMTYKLTAKLEDEYYFPFKLRNDGKGGLVGPELEPLRGKYFTQIKDNLISVADQEVTVEDLFGGAPDYKVPVIEYTKASQRQIHEVFKLYNKQGMHLNAEEIRNAVYHDVEITRAILVAAGDANPKVGVSEVAPSLSNVPEIKDLGKTLAEYGFGESRYRRTKVLGWLIAVLLNDTGGKLLPSTATHIDTLLRQVQDSPSHSLRTPATLANLFSLISEAADIHASHDELWPEKFRGDGRGAKWQDLQLIGTLVGVSIALVSDPTGLEDRMDARADAIRSAALTEWRRPEKTQTRTQWDYIGRVAQGIVQLLEIDAMAASKSIRERFGSSGVESLFGSILEISE